MAAPDLFSVPRRFDLFTVLVATAAYAILFTALRMLDVPASGLGWAGGLFATVAVGQAISEGRASPRKASIVAAMVFWLVFFAALVLTSNSASPGRLSALILFAFFSIATYGLVTGYLVGVLVAGVFLVSYHLRAYFTGERASQESTASHEEPSPWDEPTDVTASFPPPGDGGA
jgi:hypothetical protein